MELTNVSVRVKAACGLVAAAVALPVAMLVAPAASASTAASPSGVSAVSAATSSQPSKVAAAKKCKKGKKGKKCRKAKARARKRVAIGTRLLRVSDLGSGWQKQAISASDKDGALDGVSVSPAECLPTGSSLPGSTKSADRAFKRGDSQINAALGQTIGRYRNAAAARSSMAVIDERADACQTMEITTEYGPVSATVRPTSTPTYGDQTMAYKVVASQGLISGEAYIVAIRDGRWVTVVGYGEPFSASKPFMLSVASKAASRLN